MQTMEILAPAGGQSQLMAAVRCGANAVYLGAKGFNARQNADNFTDLSQAVAYCHARNVRVYVTVNTLVTDEELPALLDTLREVAQSGADAIIVQDLAVAALARAHCPTLELHASTQMTLHNIEGAKLAQSLGFSRAVLARELTIEEIRQIHEQTDLALEVFVHGALCMSASGACYLSSMLGGRSGNRGLCAQPCRLDFRSEAGRAYALSLKDLSAFPHLEALFGAGVAALKIEGRMKRAEYVAAAVTACRQALAGEPYDLRQLQDVFSRGGFTDGYLTGRRTLSMFGMRDAAGAEASRQVHGTLHDLYRHEWPGVPVDMALSLAPDAPAALSVTDGTHTVSVQGPVPETALTAPTDEARARRSLSKTGESPFELSHLRFENPDGLMLPGSALGGMRREALGALLALREAPTPHAFDGTLPLPTFPPHPGREAPPLRIRLATAAQCWPGMQAEQIILPADEITEAHLAAFGPRLIAEIPALFFPSEEAALRRALASLRDRGLSGAWCNNLGAIGLAQGAGLAAHGGYGLNLLNSVALAEAARLGLADATVSFELHQKKIAALGGDLPRGILAYGHLPLMQLRCCPAQTAGGCAGCDGHPTLRDRKGMDFPLACHRHRFVTLLNPIPLDIRGETFRGVDFFTLYFTNETAAECRRIQETFQTPPPATAERTRGLYFRQLQ